MSVSAKDFIKRSYNVEDWKYSNINKLNLSEDDIEVNENTNIFVTSTFDKINSHKINIVNATLETCPILSSKEVKCSFDKNTINIKVLKSSEKPIFIFNEFNTANLLSNIKILINENVFCKIFLLNNNNSNKNLLHSTKVEIVQEQGSNLELFKTTKNSAGDVFNFASITLNKNASLTASLLAQGCSFERNQWQINHISESSNANISALLNVKNNLHCDFDILNNHLGNNCFSNIIVRAAAASQANCGVTGKIVVAKHTTGNEAHLDNKNLITADGGIINARPQLEIYSDDVQCSHGATVGNINMDHVFYLQSRGISFEQASKMLEQAFLSMVENIIAKNWQMVLERL